MEKVPGMQALPQLSPPFFAVVQLGIMSISPSMSSGQEGTTPGFFFFVVPQCLEHSRGFVRADLSVFLGHVDPLSPFYSACMRLGVGPPGPTPAPRG